VDLLGVGFGYLLDLVDEIESLWLRAFFAVSSLLMLLMADLHCMVYKSMNGQ
jgi:hypothetical protein